MASQDWFDKDFYSVLGVTLFVPVLGGLISGRARSREALLAIGCGLAALTAIGLGPLAGRYRWLDPTLAGIVISAVAFACSLGLRRRVRLQAGA